MTNQSILLSGLGAITARGDFTLRALSNESTPATSTPPDEFLLPDFQLSHYLDSKKTYLDRCSALALAGCALALRDANVVWPLDDEEFGIVLGTHLGCIETMKAFWDKAGERGVRLAPPLLFSHSYFNSPISLCAIEYGLKGYHTTVCAGHQSGLEAVRMAFDALRLGHAEAMLCGGVEAVTPTRQQCEPGEESTPLGEASVFFMLETKAHAEARNAEYTVPISETDFDAALQQYEKVRERFGDCGGAEGALCLLENLAGVSLVA